jgi:hypothetical protein
MKAPPLFFNLSVLCTFLFTSCASIVSRSSCPLAINTKPPGADVSIRDKDGVEIFRGSSPAIVDLQSGAGYFSKASYTLIITKTGYKDRILPINFRVNEWYFGNFIIGGLIGFLIVDPLTGAMWKIERGYINTVLDESPATGNVQLNIYDIADVPGEWQCHMVRIQ